MAAISITNEHARRNESTRGRWEAMASHRSRIMALLDEASRESAGSLCLMGAGNGHDIDLAKLATDFERITLVDLDRTALDRNVSRLNPNAACCVSRHSPFDLSGILPVLESWQAHRRPTDSEISAVKQSAQIAPCPNVGTFDVVASTCMLTQLIDSVYMAVPTEHPRCVELVMAVRNRHLEIMLELLNPDGAGVLVTDFVATDTAPELAQLDELVLPQAAMRWIEQRNFFTGANPFAIREYFNQSRGPGPFAEDVQVKGPWRWDIGAKQLAVCAVTFRRRG